MSNIYTLDDIRNDLDKQFAPVVIDGVTLRPLLRLGRKDREKVMAAFQVTQKADTSTPEGLEEMITNLQTIISVVAGDRGPELVEKIGDDVALLVKITELWAEATQPGEASKSPS